MKKKTIILLISAMLILVSAFVLLNANKNNEYNWISDETAAIREDLLSNQDNIATVNGVGLPERELLRRVFNVEILYKMELLKYKKMLAAGEITKGDYQQRVDALTKQKNETDVKENLLLEMIEDEIAYQAATERGFLASDSEVEAYYKNISSKLPAEQIEVLTQYAKGLGMTLDAYVQDYILPLYKVKLTIGNMYTGLLEDLKLKYPNEVVNNVFLQNSNEYKELVGQLKENAVVIRND